MRPWSDIPRADVDAWNADLLHYRPGGAENVLDVAGRVQAFVADLRGEEPEALGEATTANFFRLFARAAA